MVALPPRAVSDPTLDAADAAMIAAERRQSRRTYIGMSGIGDECSRKLWYRFHTEHREVFDAATLKRFADGHASEDVQATRLRAVPGITLITLDPDTGRQIGFEDLDGQFRGHADGLILGLLQAPNRWHIWEHKAVKEEKQSELHRLKITQGEKQALWQWNPVYYGQAVLYMHYSGLERHYLTCATPGTRTVISVRTDANTAHALTLRDKAQRIIQARVPLARVSSSPDWWQCRMCGFRDVCHGGEK